LAKARNRKMRRLRRSSKKNADIDEEDVDIDLDEEESEDVFDGEGGNLMQIHTSEVAFETIEPF
jgi:hypothetical protein